MPYNPTVWENGSEPSISAANLNKMEQGIADVLTLSTAQKYGLGADAVPDAVLAKLGKAVVQQTAGGKLQDVLGNDINIFGTGVFDVTSQKMMNIATYNKLAPYFTPPYGIDRNMRCVSIGAFMPYCITDNYVVFKYGSGPKVFALLKNTYPIVVKEISIPTSYYGLYGICPVEDDHVYLALSDSTINTNQIILLNVANGTIVNNFTVSYTSQGGVEVISNVIGVNKNICYVRNGFDANEYNIQYVKCVNGVPTSTYLYMGRNKSRDNMMPCLWHLDGNYLYVVKKTAYTTLSLQKLNASDATVVSECSLPVSDAYPKVYFTADANFIYMVDGKYDNASTIFYKNCTIDKLTMTVKWETNLLATSTIKNENDMTFVGEYLVVRGTGGGVYKINASGEWVLIPQSLFTENFSAVFSPITRSGFSTFSSPVIGNSDIISSTTQINIPSMESVFSYYTTINPSASVNTAFVLYIDDVIGLFLPSDFSTGTNAIVYMKNRNDREIYCAREVGK